MENRKKIHGRVRGRFLAVPPVMDLNSEKKDELLKNIFDKKINQPVILPKQAPIKISKLEKVALPVLIVVAVVVGWSLLFDLFFYKIKIDFKKEAKIAFLYFFDAAGKSVSYIKDDFKIVSNGPSLNLAAGVGFLGDKIADIAETGSLKTISLINNQSF